MPRYFFYLTNGSRVVNDSDGVEHESNESARLGAIHFAGLGASRAQIFSLPRWSGVQLPGMKLFGPPPHTHGSIFDKICMMTPDLSTYRIDAQFQPYFKLHGSINWVIDESSARLCRDR
jgi:hypothetical protein